jgi:hypothetical protein
MSGGSYGLAGETFEMSTCELDPAVRCEHWEAVFGKAGRITEERRNARLQQQAHVRDRVQEAEDKNQDTAAQLQVLESLLVAGVASARPLDFASLKVEPEMPAFG